MKRRDFLRSMIGAMGAVALGPMALEMAKKTPPIEASFIIPPQEIYDWLVPPTIEMVDELVARTTLYWNELALKNFMEGMRQISCE